MFLKRMGSDYVLKRLRYQAQRIKSREIKRLTPYYGIPIFLWKLDEEINPAQRGRYVNQILFRTAVLNAIIYSDRNERTGSINDALIV